MEKVDDMTSFVWLYQEKHTFHCVSDNGSSSVYQGMPQEEAFVLDSLAQLSSQFLARFGECHYYGDIMEWYRTNNIDFIPKIQNPPNYQKLRSIEEYWSIVKGILRKSGGAAKDINSMRLRWNSTSDKVSP